MVMLYPQDARIKVLAPVVRGRKGEFKKELAALRARGYTKARIDGQFSRSKKTSSSIAGAITPSRSWSTDLIVRRRDRARLTESVDAALNLAEDIVGDRRPTRAAMGCSRGGSACVDCGLSVPEMTRWPSRSVAHGAWPGVRGWAR